MDEASVLFLGGPISQQISCPPYIFCPLYSLCTPSSEMFPEPWVQAFCVVDVSTGISSGVGYPMFICALYFRQLRFSESSSSVAKRSIFF